ncbi:unnamed protein product, partial [Rotaria sordida]
EKRQEKLYSNLKYNKSKNKQVEHLIRSEKYRYITMLEVYFTMPLFIVPEA